MSTSALDQLHRLVTPESPYDLQKEDLKAFLEKLQELREIGLEIGTSLESGIVVWPTPGAGKDAQEGFVTYQNGKLPSLRNRATL